MRRIPMRLLISNGRALPRGLCGAHSVLTLGSLAEATPRRHQRVHEYAYGAAGPENHKFIYDLGPSGGPRVAALVLLLSTRFLHTGEYQASEIYTP